jgi:hypothetical protein
MYLYDIENDLVINYLFDWIFLWHVLLHDWSINGGIGPLKITQCVWRPTIKSLGFGFNLLLGKYNHFNILNKG